MNENAIDTKPVDDPRTITYIRKVQPYLDIVTEMKGENVHDTEIAKFLNISPTSFYKFKRSIPELDEAYRQGMQIMIHDVESAAFREAMGYTYEEEMVVPKSGDVVTIKKYARGNATVQKYLLNNKKSKEYADKKQIETTQKVAPSLDILKSLGVDALRQLLAEVDEVEVVDVTSTPTI